MKVELRKFWEVMKTLRERNHEKISNRKYFVPRQKIQG